MADTSKYHPGFLERFVKNSLAGTVSGIAVCLVGHPMDTLKIRLQTQPVHNPVYKGLIDCLVKTIKWEGVFGLYRGVTSPILGQMSFRAVLFTTYFQVSSWLAETPGARLSASQFFLAGAITGSAAVSVEGPMELLKTKMQVQIIKIKTGAAPEYRNVFHAGSVIARTYGIRGIYQAFWATQLRSTPGTSCYFGVFEGVRDYLTPEGGSVMDLPSHKVFLAGSTAGMAYWLLVYPLDVIKSTLQADDSNPAKRKYNGVRDCARKLYLQEGGWRRFYRGFTPCLIRAAPANATMLVVLEKSGVVGLSTALCITNTLGPSYKVTVVAREFTPNTTSDGAFGYWSPYLVQDTPPEDIKRWGSLTLRRMLELAHSVDGPAACTFTFSGFNIHKSRWKDPLWKDMVPFFRPMEDHELKQYGQEYVHGWAFQSAATECRFYLPWLTRMLKGKGVKFVRAHVSDLTEAVNEDLLAEWLSMDYDVVVNCAGLGSYELLKDKYIKPVQGQVIRVNAPWVKHFINSNDEDLYILPGIDSVLLGGSNVENVWNTEVDKFIRDRILQGCQRIMPSLKNARIIADWVGLRPSRTHIRLETEILQTSHGNFKVVHNYGHGGAEITLHWGCALDAANKVRECFEGKVHAQL